MGDVIKEAYDKCLVGETRTVTLDAACGDSLDGFQAVLTAAETMHQRRLIYIKSVQRNSENGNRSVDAITFMRLF
jgi:hypothetical protein